MKIAVPPTEPPTWEFDAEALYIALDRKRRERRIRSARQILREAGISTPSTLTRLGQGSGLSADTLVRLLGWMGETDMTPYMRESTRVS